MQKQLKKLLSKVTAQIEDAKTPEKLRDLEVAILGRKGELTAILRGLSDLSADEKPVIGKLANEIKQSLTEKIDSRKKGLEQSVFDNLAEDEWIDVTVPGTRYPIGHQHPISRFIQEVQDVFGRMGFDIADSQEVETDYYNFTSLNLPEDHPAREMQDTFYIENLDNYVLRTQTSSTQIRYMENREPPFRIIGPGKTYRKDSDATHSPMFHQFEGLMVDKNISIAHLRSVLIDALGELLGHKVNVRFRTSFFPFVEPGLEVDVSCVICDGKGKVENKKCKVCQGSGWLEMGGAGSVHPQVLKNVNIDPEEYTGFAFGFGIERPIMIKYKIDDLRLFFNNDLRFLEQF